jgi:hypothetical protein
MHGAIAEAGISLHGRLTWLQISLPGLDKLFPRWNFTVIPAQAGIQSIKNHLIQNVKLLACG